ncbi:hypothetical protein AB0D49_18020 [Streptomyces sp. NPDC048290]|uniref:hypothetical protein n=1 Tax=Streptomyces sp. NPDC048290 TaxID=3155811 RepID=UPI003419BAB4
MTGPAVPRVPRDALGLGPALGDGGQGKVYEVPNRLINRTWPVVYKEYKPHALAELRVDALERLAAFLPGRPAAEGRWLAVNTAWPAALVTDGGRVTGFLMCRIPDQFFVTLPGGVRKTAGFEFLLNPLPFVERTVGAISPHEVYGLLLALAEVLDRLHGLGVVVSDLSPKNVLFSRVAGQRPACFLIDCDAMGIGGSWALRPVQTPGWVLPQGEQPGTLEGDRYKFALLAVRLFLHEQHGADPAPLRRADPRLGALAAAGLSGTPADRPALSAWLEPLRRACAAPATAWPGPSPSPGIRHGSRPRTTTQGPRTTGQRPPTTRTPPTTGATPTTGTAPTTGTTPTTGATPAGRTTAGGGAGPRQVRPPARPVRKGGAKALFWSVLVLVGLAYVQDWPPFDGSGAITAPGGSSGDSAYGDSGTGTDSGTDPGTDSGSDPSPDSGTDSGTDTGTEESGPQDEAAALDALLAENMGRRSGVAEAVQMLLSCEGTDDAREVFESAAVARDDQVERLDTMDLGQLPEGLADHLRTAWQSSATADWAYVDVVDQVGGDCTTEGVTGSSAWQEAAQANEQATAAKKDFVAGWNPLAVEYALTELDWTDL